MYINGTSAPENEGILSLELQKDFILTVQHVF